MLKLSFSLVLIIFMMISATCSFKCLAQSQDPEALKKSLEIVNKDKDLMSKLGKENKVFIREITVNGAVSVSSDQLDEIISSYKNRSLTREDISQIKKSIRVLYRKNKLGSKLKRVRSKVKSDILQIQITEQV